MLKSHDFQKSLLKWYDRNRRDLPWRAKAGVKPDPYHVWLSEIMLQQTTVGAVIPYFEKFLKRWPNLKTFAEAERDEILKEWAGLGYYARARNLHKCAQELITAHNGVFPDTEEGLLNLSGIGSYTAAAISAIAFEREAIVIDANVDRIVARVFAIETPIKQSKILICEKAKILYKKISRPGDFAQALMDLGSAVCIPQTPRCESCPVSDFCRAYKKGLQNELPIKMVKQQKPQRSGKVYWLKNAAGEVLMERRQENRMLGGMMGFPTTDWDGKQTTSLSKTAKNRLKYVDEVNHSFTHFDLKLEIWRGSLTKTDAQNGLLISSADLASMGLPSVFQKIRKIMLAHEK